MNKRSRFIKLVTQGVLALILLISPVSGYSGSVSSGHPKIHTVWVASSRQEAVHIRKISSKKRNPTPRHHLYQFAVAGKLKAAQGQQQSHSRPRTQLQKTIPYGTEDELIA
ncbi:MAG: hypothetical protein KIT62_07980 [Cyclobacteriaceae bacterium]|nr:hypothetical protein [Cyclobacteriaceae bacterium]